MVTRSPLSSVSLCVTWPSTDCSSKDLDWPRDSEIIEQSPTFPWNKSSSSACHPTDMPPLSYRFRLQQFGHLPCPLRPHRRIMVSMISSIQGGNSVGSTSTPPYLYEHLHGSAVTQSVCLGSNCPVLERFGWFHAA